LPERVKRHSGKQKAAESRKGLTRSRCRWGTPFGSMDACQRPTGIIALDDEQSGSRPPNARLRRRGNLTGRDTDRPARYTLLNVVPQPERAGFEDPPPPHEDYLDALTKRAQRNLGVPNPDGVLFVSRSGVRNEFVGETYLDEVFARAGATIMHPETMSLVDQLRGYAEHEILIFSEGSAFHGFQQLGRHPGVGVILKRRPDVDFGHVVGPPGCLSLTSRTFCRGWAHSASISHHTGTRLDFEGPKQSMPCDGCAIKACLPFVSVRRRYRNSLPHFTRHACPA